MMRNLHFLSTLGDRAGKILALACLTLLTLACSDDDTSSSSNGGSSGSAGSGGSGAQTPEDGVDEAVLAACPEASTLIETTEWPSCLAGTRLLGVEPFSGDACELHIGENAAFEYRVNGELSIAVPERSKWMSASGTYQNEGEGARRIFLASVAPDLEPVEGEPRVTRITISLFGLASQEDTVEVAYMDSALARQTYNCMVDAL